MTEITGLRCEHAVDPLGVESSAPRLSWRMESGRRGARQVAYRITVDTDRADAGPADLWDSGWIESDVSVLVPYAGKKLSSRRRCRWRVFVRDETGAETGSSWAFWEMGLLKQSDWKARWITGSNPARHDNLPASPIFRKNFNSERKVVSARAYVSGLGFYEFYLNGRKISDYVLHPAFTKYDEKILYTVYDITEDIQQDANVAGLMLGTGWYNHHRKDSWLLYAAPWRDECKALCQIEIIFEDGVKKTVCSDSSWLVSSGPIVFDGLRDGEIYDAREEKNGWTDAGYDKLDMWRPARIARPPGGRFAAQLMPPCRVGETVRPVSVKEVKPGVFVYDLGRNIAGWVRLRVEGPAGAEVTMRYAETLGADGDIDQSNIRQHIETDRFQTDTYILKGAGVEAFEPRFAYHGFQYVQVTGLPCQAEIDTVEGCVVNTDIEQTGAFECSDELVNQIQRAAVAATLGNYHGMPTDCPHREKNGWTGDAQLSAEQVLYNFEPSSSYSKWMDDFADCQRQSGALPGIVPTGGWGFNWGAGPAWDSTYILIPWYLYVYRGDLEILRRHYDGMKRYMGFLDAISSGYIVKFGLGDWCPPSSGPERQKTPDELTNTAYYYADACVMAKIAGLLGKNGDEKRFVKLAEKIKKAARKHYYDVKNKKLAGHGQTSISCFMYQGLMEPGECDVFSEMLLAEIEVRGEYIDCGILGAKYLLNTLTDIGRPDVAFRIITQREYPGWGWWIGQGATTLWETWEGGASRNHHMFSDVSAWFYKTLAGIMPDPESPGFKQAVIKPCPVGGLAFAKGEIMTPYGRLSSAWRMDGDRFVLDLVIPPNSRAVVYVPAASDDAVTEGGCRASAAEGVKLCFSENGRVGYEISAGSYSFAMVFMGAPGSSPASSNRPALSDLV